MLSNLVWSCLITTIRVQSTTLVSKEPQSCCEKQTPGLKSSKSLHKFGSLENQWTCSESGNQGLTNLKCLMKWFFWYVFPQSELRQVRNCWYTDLATLLLFVGSVRTVWRTSLPSVHCTKCVLRRLACSTAATLVPHLRISPLLYQTCSTHYQLTILLLFFRFFFRPCLLATPVLVIFGIWVVCLTVSQRKGAPRRPNTSLAASVSSRHVSTAYVRALDHNQSGVLYTTL